MRERGMDKEKPAVMTRNFLQSLAKGSAKSIPGFGGLIEEMIFGTLDGEAAEKKHAEVLAVLNDIQQHLQGQTVDVDRLLDALKDRVALPEEIVSKIDALASAVANIDRPPSDSVEAAVQAVLEKQKVHNLPQRNQYFTGRVEILDRIATQVKAKSGIAGLTQVHGISGLGGIGKSQTALEYAYRHLEVDYDVALWVRADTDSELVGGFIEAARLLGLVGEGPQKDEDIVGAVRAWLGTHARWLLILDNVEGDRQDAVKAYIPHGDGGHVLITSRAAELDVLGVPKPIALDKMGPNEAREFLYDRTERDEDGETDAVDAIAEALDYLPLALEQAAAYIIAKDCRFADYGTSFEQHRKEFLRQRPVAGDHREGVATTWSMNFEQVAGASAASADLLCLAAFLDPERIPLELVREGAAELGEDLAEALGKVNDDPIVLNEVLEPLERYSLIRVDCDDDSFSIHRLVQQAVRDQLDGASERKWGERTVRADDAAFPHVEFKTWPLCDRLLPHAHAAIALIKTQGFETEYDARLLHGTAYFLNQRGRYADAEPLNQHAINIAERALSPDHPILAATLNNLAAVYEEQGRYAEAEPLYQRARDIHERVLGPGHPDFATSLNNMAELYRAQGRYAEAEPLYQSAINIAERALGPDHPDLATMLTNLAKVYDDQGRYADAEGLYQRARDIRERALEADHPYLAISLNDLALLYYAQGRYAEAEPLFQGALNIYERTLDPDHREFVTTLNNLALLYYAQGRYAEAEPLFQRALEIRKRAACTDHPEFATLLNNVASLYDAQGRYAEAEPLLQRALDIRKRVLSPDHPDVAATLNNLASLYRDQDRYAEAEPLYQRALAIWEKALPADHPNLATGCANYAGFLRKLGRDAEALEYEARSAAIKKERARGGQDGGGE